MSAKKPQRPTPRKRSAKAPKPLWQRIKWRRAALLAVAMVVVPFFGYVVATYAFVGIPEPDKIARVQSVTVTDHQGKYVGRVDAGADRVSVPLRQMPEHFRQAVLATEDRRFYEHKGVRITSIFRAALANVFGDRQGGSTITQQYVKNAFVGNERTIGRKIKEAILSIKFERQRSKNEILAAYLNTVYFGRGAYGCEAAANVYFRANCRDLTLEQSALLAAIIKAPSTYDPTRNEEQARQRRDLVLGFMVRDKHITEERAERAKRAPLGAQKRRVSRFAPHFLEDVKDFLEAEIEPRVLYGGGVRVRSTLSLDMQRAAEAAVSEVRRPRNDPDAALVAIDPKTGAIRALVGARSFARSELNLARSRQQPGSTFKPVVLARAVEEETSPEQPYPAPASVTIGGKKVSNYDGRNHGRLSVRRATELSVNTVYAQLIRDVGSRDVAEIGRRLGVASSLDPERYGSSLALGAADVTPVELAGVYATFAARGKHAAPYIVERVTGKGGRVLYQRKPEVTDALEENVADTVNDVLRGVITSGTGRRADIGRPAAGKTGTTDGCADVWFAGYTPDLATVVWNGNANNKPMMENGECPIFGGTFSARIWALFMREALKGVPPTNFVRPKGIAPSTSPTTTSSPSPTATATPTPTPTRTQSSPKPKPRETKQPSPEPTVEASPSPTPVASPSG